VLLVLYYIYHKQFTICTLTRITETAELVALLFFSLCLLYMWSVGILVFLLLWTLKMYFACKSIYKLQKWENTENTSFILKSPIWEISFGAVTAFKTNYTDTQGGCQHFLYRISQLKTIFQSKFIPRCVGGFKFHNANDFQWIFG